MAITLVRKESDTPNIQNSDDIRAFKYAGLGINGVVKGYLNECGYEVSNNTLTIKSGEIIVDSWQVDLDASGASIVADNISGLMYYTVYVEVDLSVSDNKTVKIKAVNDSVTYPKIDAGDDISVTDTGIARLALYTFDATGGVISNVKQSFEILDGDNHRAKYTEYSINAEKAIYKKDGTYEGFVKDENEKLTNSTGQIEQKKVIWSGYHSHNPLVNNQETSIELNESVSFGDVIEITFSPWGTANDALGVKKQRFLLMASGAGDGYAHIHLSDMSAGQNIIEVNALLMRIANNSKLLLCTHCVGFILSQNGVNSDYYPNFAIYEVAKII